MDHITIKPVREGDSNFVSMNCPIASTNRDIVEISQFPVMWLDFMSRMVYVKFVPTAGNMVRILVQWHVVFL